MPDIEGQLRNTIIGRMTDTFAQSSVPFLDMAANQAELGQKIVEGVKPTFAELGLVARKLRGREYLACPTSCKRCWISASA